MNTAGLHIITRKRRWELIAEQDAVRRYRDGLLGAMCLMIAVVLLAVYLT